MRSASARRAALRQARGLDEQAARRRVSIEITFNCQHRDPQVGREIQLFWRWRESTVVRRLLCSSGSLPRRLLQNARWLRAGYGRQRGRSHAGQRSRKHRDESFQTSEGVHQIFHKPGIECRHGTGACLLHIAIKICEENLSGALAGRSRHTGAAGEILVRCDAAGFGEQSRFARGLCF